MSLPNNIREIKLTQGQIAIVDADMFEFLNQFKWYAGKKRDTFYATRGIRHKGWFERVSMHRLIMGVVDTNILVDHIDHNGLHNFRSNLRICSTSENCTNRRPKINGTSKYFGVRWYEKNKAWGTSITKNAKNIFLGLFKNEIDAAKVHDAAAKEFHGEFASLNFKDDTRQVH